MIISIPRAGRFVLLWVFCPLVALATFRILFGGVAVHMSGFLYQVEMRPLAFYSHIYLASVALALVPFQLWPGLRRRRVELHRLLGRIYAIAILVSGIGALILAVTTRSGVVASWGFGLLAVAWVGATFYGVFLAMKSNVRAHQDWMIRSAALTMAAVSLRIIVLSSELSGISYQEVVGFVAWACWVPNLVIAEFIIWRGRQNAAAKRVIGRITA